MARRAPTRRRRPEITPVDDIRRVRKLLHEQANGDIDKLIKDSVRVAAELRERLGMKTAPPPPSRKKKAG